MAKKTSDPESRKRKRRVVVSALFPNYQRTLCHEIEMIRRYVATVTASFVREFREYEDYVRQDSEGASDEQTESLYEDWLDAKSHFLEEFPSFTYTSTFVATYAFFEHKMFDIARLVGRRLSIELEPQELADRGITAAKKYLEKLCQITIPNERPWQEAVNLGDVRNVLIHAGGRVKEGNDKLRKYVAGKKAISIDENNQLKLTEDFCLDALECVEIVLTELLQVARRRTSTSRPPKGRHAPRLPR